MGHTVKLIAPKFVVPYRKSGKNDGNDAEAICEAVTRPNMRFVPIKTAERLPSSRASSRYTVLARDLLWNARQL
jgi:transposase